MFLSMVANYGFSFPEGGRSMESEVSLSTTHARLEGVKQQIAFRSLASTTLSPDEYPELQALLTACVLCNDAELEFC